MLFKPVLYKIIIPNLQAVKSDLILGALESHAVFLHPTGSYVRVMLAHLLQRWRNITPPFGECFVFSGGCMSAHFAASSCVASF